MKKYKPEKCAGCLTLIENPGDGFYDQANNLYFHRIGFSPVDVKCDEFNSEGQEKSSFDCTELYAMRTGEPILQVDLFLF